MIYHIADFLGYNRKCKLLKLLYYLCCSLDNCILYYFVNDVLITIYFLEHQYLHNNKLIGLSLFDCISKRSHSLKSFFLGNNSMCYGIDCFLTGYFTLKIASPHFKRSYAWLKSLDCQSSLYIDKSSSYLLFSHSPHLEQPSKTKL